MPKPYFVGALRLSPHGDTSNYSGLPRYRVDEEFTFEVPVSAAVCAALTVPAGYVTDLASIPWPTRKFWKPDDPHWAQAAVLHDFLCGQPAVYARHFCDYVYLMAMLASGTNPRIAWMQYAFLKVRAVYLKLFSGRGYYLPTA